jgi:hypothetical protein
MNYHSNLGCEHLGVQKEPGAWPSFVELIREQYHVERVDRKTGELTLVSIDEALNDLRGCHSEPLEHLLQHVTLAIPWAFYRLHVARTFAN